jgi:FlaA1/EpsC-like NDP-sugar epimerase
MLERIRRHRSPVAMALYAAVVAASYVLAYLLRFDFSIPAQYVFTLSWTLPFLVVVRLAATRWFRLTTGRWRFVSTGDAVRLASATVAGTAVFWLLLLVFPEFPPVPRSVLVLELLLTPFLIGTLWLGYRVSFEQMRQRGSGINGSAKRVVIIGAGEAGNLLAREIIRFPSGYRLAGFVDDDRVKRGATLHGVGVLGRTANLARIVKEVRAQEVIIATPSATPDQLRDIVAHCETVNLPFKVLPGIAEVLEGEVSLNQLRPLQIEDLLGRKPVRLSLPELAEDLQGRVALVTGAAGSIGSELARQIAANAPARLVLIDQAESDLFFVERELRERFPAVALVVVVGDILDQPLIDAVFENEKVDRVYHAAAYKHVPLMEENVRAAVLNNVLGTWRIAEAAGKHRVGKFVLISTDKAVRPSSVMGATKRLAEIVVTSCQSWFDHTEFMAVRFGNVLGSNGSVVPIFQKQIAERKPITVTDPDVTRYFMTIAEAVQLVLQASLLDEGAGKVAMLDMGNPVKIVDLAKNMIRLSGLKPDRDIKIVFTGLRPGEKLHEELSGIEEGTERTRIEKVRLICPPRQSKNGAPYFRLETILEAISHWEYATDGSSPEKPRERLLEVLKSVDVPAHEVPKITVA